MNNIIRYYEDLSVVIITAYDFENPLNNLKSLVADLKSYSFSGTVIFDLIFFNDNLSDRFASLNFDGESFSKRTLILSNHLDHDLEIDQNNLLKENKFIIENSVLPSYIKKSFLNT